MIVMHSPGNMQKVFYILEVQFVVTRVLRVMRN